MEKIYFENKINPKLKFLIILSIPFVLLGSLNLIPFNDPRINKYSSVIGFLLLTIYFSRMFWYKNYVQWNYKGIHIKIKSFIGKSISFEKIKENHFNKETITITKTNGKKITINLEGISKSDTEKLNKIITENMITN